MAGTNLIVKTPEMLNALTNKFVDLEGLKVFWANAKSYVDTQDAALQDQIDDLKSAVSGGTFFRGVFESTDLVTDPKNGDVVVVKVKDAEGNVIGDKEYIYNGTTSEWVELGDVTAEQQRISALETAIADMDAEYALDAEGAGEGEVAVVTGVNLTQVDGKITAMTVDSAKAATKTYVDGRFDALDAEEIAAATATDLVANEIAVVTGVTVEQVDGLITSVSVDSAKAATTAYVDNAIDGIGIGDYYTKGEVDDLLTANSEADQAYTDTVAGNYTEGETVATGLRKEIEERDAATLTSANTYTDEAIAAIEFTFASHEDIDGIFGVTHE